MFHVIRSSHPGVIPHYVAASDPQGLVWVKSKEAALKFSAIDMALTWLRSLKHSGIGTQILQIGDKVIL